MPPKNLPEGAKRIYVAAEENARKSTCKDSGDRKDECANRVAWAAVKRKYKKGADGTWIPKAEEFSMAITRASYDKKSATRRWRATASDTDEDSYQDNMTLELFNDFLHRIETNEQPPESYISDFWSGGKPYLSISHYPDLNGKGVPGPVDTVFIDGRVDAGRGKLKSTGRFDDTPIGRACFESVCKDLYDEENPTPEDEKIRISIAFLDWKHRHKSNGFEFDRAESEDIICPECLKELILDEYEGKEFLRGHLVHLGMTRVPVNKRTDMEVEKSMATQKEDAASIIGEELAEELDEEAKEAKAVVKSEVVEDSPELVVKADDEDPEVVIVEEGKNKKKEEMEDEDDEEEEEKKKKKKPHKKAELSDESNAIVEEILSKFAKEQSEPHPLDESLEQIKSAYDLAVEMDDMESSLQVIREPFEALSEVIRAGLTPVEVEEAQVEQTEDSSLREILSEFKSDIQKDIGLLRAEITAIKTNVQEEVAPQVPPRRSIPSSLLMQQEKKVSETPGLRKIVESSVRPITM